MLLSQVCGEVTLQVAAHPLALAPLGVRAGALPLDPGIRVAIVLVQPAPSDPSELTEAWISERGLNVSGVVNADRLVRQLAADS